MLWHAILTVFLILLLYKYSLMIPFQTEADLPNLIMDLLMSGLFLIDLVCTVTIWRKIYLEYLGKNYIIKYLPFDLIALIPAVPFFGDDNIRENWPATMFFLFSLVKTVKVRKYYDFFKNMNSIPSKMKNRLSIFMFFVLVYSMIHMAACVWYSIAVFNHFEPESWVVRKGYQDKGMEYIYPVAVYWAITTLTTVGYGDVTARTTDELSFSLVWMFFGIIFYTCIISILTTNLTH
jgi:hypothetical protein